MKELPPGWQVVPLDDLKAVEPGAITDGPFGSKLTSAHYSAEGARVVRLQNIGDGVFKEADAFIPWEHFKSLRKHEVRAGDLLIASLGDDPPRACLAPANLGPAIVKADCIRVRLAADVDPRWVLYAMRSPDLKRWATEQMHGVGRLRLGLKTIRALPIPLPSLGEQRRIVELLDDHLSRLDAAESYLVAVRRRLAAYQQQSLETVLTTSSSEHVALGSVVERVEAGKSFGGSAPPAVGAEWGVIKVSAMTWGEFQPTENKAVPSGAVNPSYEIAPGDVLVSRANTTAYVGAPVLVRETPSRRLLSDKSLRLVPPPDVNREWLVAALSAPGTRRQISAAATGTSDSMRNISQKNLLSVQIPWVPVEDQARVVERLSAARTAASALAQESQRGNARSQGLRRAVLDAAFSGRLTGHASDMDRVEELAAASS